MSQPLISEDHKGYLHTSISAEELLARDDVYQLVDGLSGQTTGTLETSNGWAIERSAQYPDVVNKWIFGAFSTPYADCRGKEITKNDPWRNTTYLEITALCRAVKPYSVRAQGYSGGEYQFRGDSGDLFFLEQTEGGLPTFYHLRRQDYQPPASHATAAAPPPATNAVAPEPVVPDEAAAPIDVAVTESETDQPVQTETPDEESEIPAPVAASEELNDAEPSAEGGMTVAERIALRERQKSSPAN